MDEITGRNLILLLPFYLLTVRNRFGKLEADAAARSPFLRDCARLCRFLAVTREEGTVTDTQYRSFVESMEDIVWQTTGEAPLVRKGLYDIMQETFGYVPLRERLAAQYRAEIKKQKKRLEKEIKGRDALIRKQGAEIEKQNAEIKRKNAEIHKYAAKARNWRAG